jgi:hypothetical protein
MCVLAAVIGNLALFLVGRTFLASANAAVFLTRYAAEDIGGGRALGLTLFATAAGAVLSPLLLGPTGDLAHVAGLPGCPASTCSPGPHSPQPQSRSQQRRECRMPSRRRVLRGARWRGGAQRADALRGAPARRGELRDGRSDGRCARPPARARP